MALLDASGGFLLHNSRFQDLLGYSESELCGTDLNTVIHPEERVRWSDIDLRKPFGYECRLRRNDGSVFWARISVCSLGPDCKHLVVSVEDVQSNREELEALHKSEERFRLMVEGSNEVFFFEHDDDLRLTYVSPSLKRVTGFEPDEVLGKSISEFMADNDSVELIKSQSGISADTAYVSAPFVVEGRHKNGSKLTVEVVESRYTEASGQSLLRGFARDITARKLVERQLELSDQILRRINAIVVVANGQGQITYVSPSTTRLLGFTAAELLGYGWWRHAGRNPQTWREACDKVAAAARGERPFRREVWEEVTYDRDGAPHTLLWQEAKGPGDLLIGIAQDITEKKRVDEELSRSSLQLRAIFDSAIDGMFIINGQLRYIDVNPAGCALLGRTRDEIVGQAVGDFSPANSLSFSLWERIRQDGEFVGKHQVLRPDGTRVDVEISVKANILPGLHLSLLRDVTDRARLERQFMQSQKMEALGRLAGGVAHDVNNMLMAIRGYAELLQQVSKGDGATRYVENILSAVDRAALTTRQLLAFSRQQVVQPKKLNLNSVVIEMAKLLQRTIGEDIKLQLSLAEDLGEVLADPGELGQVLLNLAVNAKDAMPNGGFLHIATTNVALDGNYSRSHLNAKTGEYVLLTVTDTGCGMDSATAAKIFEPFFTTKAPGKGTGLGLPTAYGIVKQAGGAIYVYSEPGEGTSFKVYLPRVDKIPATKESAQNAHDGIRWTILVLDDDASANDSLSEYLRHEGYNVLRANSGDEAIHVCRQHSSNIHAVISDVTMPGTDGQDIRGFLAITHPEARIIYISGFSKETLLDRGVLPPNCEFLQKPFRFSYLKQKLQRLVEPEDSSTPEGGEY